MQYKDTKIASNSEVQHIIATHVKQSFTTLDTRQTNSQSLVEEKWGNMHL